MKDLLYEAHRLERGGNYTADEIIANVTNFLKGQKKPRWTTRALAMRAELEKRLGRKPLLMTKEEKKELALLEEMITRAQGAVQFTKKSVDDAERENLPPEILAYARKQAVWAENLLRICNENTDWAARYDG